MIIRCTACQTRFRLADDKMKPAGVRVRCTNCHEVFTALPPHSQPPSASRPTLDTAGSSDASGPTIKASRPTETVQQTSLDSPDLDFDFGEFNMEELDAPADPSAGRTTSPASDLSEISFDDEFERPANTTSLETDRDDLPPLEDFNLDDEEFSGFELDGSAATRENPLDFSRDEEPKIGGDLGVTFDADVSDEALPELDRSALGTQEFFFDDTPDEPLLGSPGDQPATGPIEFSFDSSEDPFAVSEPPGAAEKPAPEHDEFVFEAPAPSAKGAVKQAPENSPVPLEARQKPAPDPQPRREKPLAKPVPRSSSRAPKTKRRKRTSGYRGALIFVLLILAGAAGYGYFGWQQGTYEPAILIERAQYLIKGQTTRDMTGQIDLTDLSSQFVINQSAGNLFVVRGRAVNNFSGARSTISVRGIIYDATGKAILQQTAFCGNPLDEAALRTLPYAKIEETMNNQFGDSLSNLNIEPGQSIPFTVVFRNIPEQVAEFNIEVADSRPGTQ